MIDHVHPRVAAVLHQAQRLQTLIDDELARREARRVTGSDADRTVEVTLDGHGRPTVVFSDLRMVDDDAVRDRVRAAHRAATTEFEAVAAADAARLDASLTWITGAGSARPLRGDDE